MTREQHDKNVQTLRNVGLDAHVGVYESDERYASILIRISDNVDIRMWFDTDEAVWARSSCWYLQLATQPDALVQLTNHSGAGTDQPVRALQQYALFLKGMPKWTYATALETSLARTVLDVLDMHVGI